jgi:hypothetical protein
VPLVPTRQQLIVTEALDSARVVDHAPDEDRVLHRLEAQELPLFMEMHSNFCALRLACAPRKRRRSTNRAQRADRYGTSGRCIASNPTRVTNRYHLRQLMTFSPAILGIGNCGVSSVDCLPIARHVGEQVNVLAEQDC